MANSYFRLKQFTIQQDRCAMKVTTDACLFGAWATGEVKSQKSKAHHVLDIGTGTGLLSLMMAQQVDADIDAIEIDSSAAEQATENVAGSPWKEKIHIIHTDIKELAGAVDKKYGIVISNPPFYENELSSENSRKNIAHHAGGLLLHELLDITSQLLDPEGRFYLMLPYKRMMEAGLLLEKYQLQIIHYALVKQSPEHGYFRVFISGKHRGNSEEKCTKNEITIWTDGQQYSKEFMALLKDYYLYL